MKEKTKDRLISLVGSKIGKYEILELVSINEQDISISKYIVKCKKCDWIGEITYKSIISSRNKRYVKCSHTGGNSVKIGDVFGKYTVLKKSPAKLCNNGLLIPYYLCKCDRCGRIVNVSVSTLYATKGRNTNDICRHEKTKIYNKERKE